MYPKLKTKKYKFILGDISLIITRNIMTEEFVRIDLVNGENKNLSGALINDSRDNIIYNLYEKSINVKTF